REIRVPQEEGHEGDGQEAGDGGSERGAQDMDMLYAVGTPCRPRASRSVRVAASPSWASIRPVGCPAALTARLGNPALSWPSPQRRGVADHRRSLLRYHLTTREPRR